MNEIIKNYGAIDIKHDLFVKDIVAELIILLQEISQIDNRNYSGILYGSLATQDHQISSDIDIMFINRTKPKNSVFKYTKERVKKISSNFGLKIDEEVPYHNKLFYTDQEIISSLYAKGLPRENGRIKVPQITSTQQLFDHTTKIRLGTNILTTPNIGIFLDQNSEQQYTKIKQQSALTLQALGAELLTANGIELYNKNDIYDALIGKESLSGRYYLGYKVDRKAVKTYIEIQIKQFFTLQEINHTRALLGFNQ